MISLLGTPPPAAARTALSGCLIVGAAPTGKQPSPARYSRATVEACLAGNERSADVPDVQQRLFVLKFLFKHPVPAALRPHTSLAVTHTNANAKDGLTIVLVVGTSPANVLHLRGQLRTALHMKTAMWSGTKKNVAWDAYRQVDTTASSIAWSKRLLAACLP